MGKKKKREPTTTLIQFLQLSGGGICSNFKRNQNQTHMYIFNRNQNKINGLKRAVAASKNNNNNKSVVKFEVERNESIFIPERRIFQLNKLTTSYGDC